MIDEETKDRRILVAEDDAVSRRKLEFTLENWGYEVITTFNGTYALEKLMADDAPSLAILDLMMPGLDGLEVCRRVRAVYRITPPYIIILTVRGDKDDIVRGLSAGANDYISKPFDQAELKARLAVGQQMISLHNKLAKRIRELEAALSRIKRLQGLLKNDNHVYAFGAFYLDARERRLLRNGQPVALTSKVFDLLLLLVQNKGHLLGKDEIMGELWPDSFVEDNNLTVSISNLRKALGEHLSHHQYIETVARKGYRFIADVAQVID
jgi:DNA-binding response OmpR family regulator